jgi:hypothetical protein
VANVVTVPVGGVLTTVGVILVAHGALKLNVIIAKDAGLSPIDTSGGGGGSGGGTKSKWKLDKDGSDRIREHKTNNRKYYRRQGSAKPGEEYAGEWWSVDDAKHGGSAFKVYRGTSGGLEWTANADEFGRFIIGQHKSDAGIFIPWDDIPLSWIKPGT